MSIASMRIERLVTMSTVIGLFIVMTACLASRQSADGGLDAVRGEASYYGDKFAGRTTASGEPFDPEAMTAAHRSLPFGSRVRVTRVGGNQSVTVRINDRGPYADNRIIDLSQAAARELGMIDEGVVEVQIEVVDTPSNDKVASSSQSADDSDSPAAGW